MQFKTIKKITQNNAYHDHTFVSALTLTTTTVNKNSIPYYFMQLDF